MRFFIYLSYDGANYHGWQIQPNGVSVQEVLQNALSTILRQPIEVVGAGRTDAGVNASMMVAHFDVNEELRMKNEKYFLPANSSENNDSLNSSLPNSSHVTLHSSFISRLNRILPQDIAVQRIVPVTNDAHARFSATSRTYHYYISMEKSPFSRMYSYRYPQPLDFDLMNKAAALLFNYTDFTSFSKLHTDVKTNNCRIMKACWEQETDGRWRFTITADRFLRNMVRAIVGTLLDVGRGKISIEEFCNIIERKDRCSAGTSVPGNALFLADITYPDNLF